jgi:hypothetical protein
VAPGGGGDPAGWAIAASHGRDLLLVPLLLRGLQVEPRMALHRHLDLVVVAVVANVDDVARIGSLQD